MLNKHPRIQKQLIDEIANKSEKEARIKVAQEIHDLKTGGIKKVEGNTYIFDETLREKIDTKIITVKHAPEYYFDMMEVLHKELYWTQTSTR